MGNEKSKPAPQSPSSARAVAWGAMFFAFLSFLISITTLLVTFDGGRLLRNLKESTLAIEETAKKFQAERATKKVEQASQGVSQSLSAQWDSLCAQLERAEGMVRGKDPQSKSYIAGIKEQFEKMKGATSAKTGDWMGEAIKTLQSTRDQLISENGPAAARNLRALAADMKIKAASVKDSVASGVNGVTSDMGSRAAAAREKIGSGLSGAQNSAKSTLGRLKAMSPITRRDEAEAKAPEEEAAPAKAEDDKAKPEGDAKAGEAGASVSAAPAVDLSAIETPTPTPKSASETVDTVPSEVRNGDEVILK